MPYLRGMKQNTEESEYRSMNEDCKHSIKYDCQFD